MVYSANSMPAPPQALHARQGPAQTRASPQEAHAPAEPSVMGDVFYLYTVHASHVAIEPLKYG